MMNDMELVSQAQKSIEENNIDQAVGIYLDLLESSADEFTQFVASRDLGFIFYQHRKMEDAANYLKQALNLPFDDEEGRINRILGYIHMQVKEFELASEHLEESLHMMSNREEEYYVCAHTLGKILFELQDYDLAINYFSEGEPFFLKKNLEYYVSSLYYLGLCRFIQKEIEVSRTYFESIIQSKVLNEKQKIHGHYGLMFILNAEKNGDALIEAAGKILESEPDFYDKETLTYFMLKAYQYQNRELEYEHLLELFLTDYPEGKYQDQYEDLKNYEFKPYIS